MTHPRRVATIDLGTNTVRLLVVDVAAAGGWVVVDQDQRVTRLGEGMAASGGLGPEPMARTCRAIVEYVERARRAGVPRPRVVATSAVREAANGREFAAEVERAAGVPVQVIAGEEEARLTVLGVRRGLATGPGPLLVFDIGGGSTEFVLARDGAVAAAVSLRLGVVALAERYPFPDTVDEDRYLEMEEGIRRRLLRELPPAIRASGAAHLVGTAGTVTTLAALDLGLSSYDAERVHGHRLDRAAIDALRNRLAGLGLAQRAVLPCVERGRADLIVPGTAIVRAALDATGTDAVVVSDWGLREGLVVAALEAAEPADPS